MALKKKKKKSSKSELFAKKVLVTHEFRVAFPHVFEPTAFKKQDPKFNLTMLFPKTTDLSLAADRGKDANGVKIPNNSLKGAAFAAAREKWGSDKDEWPEIRWPWRNGDKKKNYVGFEGHIFVKATSSEDKPPNVVDQRLKAITSPKDFYPGCWARAELIAFPYDADGTNPGVGFALMNVQKVRDDDRFGGGRDAKDVFSQVDDGSDDEDSYGDDEESEEDEDDDTFG